MASTAQTKDAEVHSTSASPCDKCPPRTTIFCPICRKADRTALRSVRLGAFIGGQSLNPRMEEFWATGDPEVFERP